MLGLCNGSVVRRWGGIVCIGMSNVWVCTVCVSVCVVGATMLLRVCVVCMVAVVGVVDVSVAHGAAERGDGVWRNRGNTNTSTACSLDTHHQRAVKRHHQSALTTHHHLALTTTPYHNFRVIFVYSRATTSVTASHSSVGCCHRAGRQTCATIITRRVRTPSSVMM